MTVRRVSGSTEAVLPADYVANHVELAYATTAFRAQGRTTDTAHAMVAPNTTREVLYVTATRGRESNRLFVNTTYDPDPATSHDGTIEATSAADVLTRVLANEGAERSAHATLERGQRRLEDFAVLAAEYETLASVAQQPRWDAMLDRSGLGSDHLEQIRRSDAYGPLFAAFRKAEAVGLDVEATFPKLVEARSLDEADDAAAVLRGRVERWAQAAGSKRKGSNFIAGLIPRAADITDPEMARALADRDETMERRGRELAAQAIERGDAWVRRLGPPPRDPSARQQWMAAISTVAAYRERWNVGNDHRPLGSEGAVSTLDAMDHRTRAQSAANAAMRLTSNSQAEAVENGGIAADATVARMEM